jgi:hypothetical protein
MKNISLKLIVVCLLLTTCCKNDDDSTNPLDQLPPATMTGAQTIGCLVNGEPFTDSGIMNNFYQFVDGEYYLVINWDFDNSDGYKDGQIAISKIEVQENQTYVLDKSSYTDGDYTGAGATFVSNLTETLGQFETNANFTGTIHFTRFDTENFIMSGTFEFQAQEIISGETITITDGRFDLNFTN